MDVLYVVSILRHQSFRNPSIRQQDFSLCLQIVTKSVGAQKVAIDKEVEEFFAEVARIRKASSSNTLQIEELITPMVYKYTTLASAAVSDKVRTVIEKACHIFKQSLIGKQITGEQVRTFFSATKDYL